MFPPDWRDFVVKEAKTWIGTPYQHKGRVKGVGVDCGGLLYEIYGQFLKLRPFPKNYAADWALHKKDEIYLDFIRDYVKEVSAPVRGGVALFQVGRNFSHAAIVVDNNKFIHSWGRNQHGGVIKSDAHWFAMGNKQRPVKYFDLAEK